MLQAQEFVTQMESEWVMIKCIITILVIINLSDFFRLDPLLLPFPQSDGILMGLGFSNVPLELKWIMQFFWLDTQKIIGLSRTNGETTGEKMGISELQETD